MIANEISDNISRNTIQNSNEPKSPIQYLLKTFKSSFPRIKFNSTSTIEIEKIICTLKPKNLHGNDGISIRILKVSAPFIRSPSCYIFDKVVPSGIFPSRLTYSIVMPLHKKGDSKNLSNYRPI
jgi:hypothetical protein